MSSGWDKYLAIVAANTIEEAKAMFGKPRCVVDDCELIVGASYDPSVTNNTAAYNDDGSPMKNVLVYEWFPCN